MQITDYTFANITARPFMTLDDVNNKWIFTDRTRHVMDVSMYREPEVIGAIKAKGATFDWLPTDERPMNLDMILLAVSKLADYDKGGSHIIVHCLHGNNRSRTVVEAYHFAKLGFHFEDEYNGCKNHLIWNCEQGYLPPLPEVEKLLKTLTPRPHCMETLLEIRGKQVNALYRLSEEELRLFFELGKKFPEKKTCELLEMAFRQAGREEIEAEIPKVQARLAEASKHIEKLKSNL